MLISNKYSDNKLYKGIRFYDKIPLMSEDLHEYEDTVYMKTAYLMNNIIGYGTLNSPALAISSNGIELREPAVILINGDISLIKSDDNTPIVSIEDIREANLSSGSVCIVGWYQSLTNSSTLRNYGGVENSIIPNDIISEKLNIQVSTRYQFRWVPIIVSSDTVTGENLSFRLAARDDTGDIISGEYSINSKDKEGSVFIASSPSAMDYALSDLYIIPIIRYSYSATTNTISDASTYLPATPKGSSGFIKSDTEPVGEYVDGTVWYNHITREFKTYVEGQGFVDSASTMGFLQYQSVYNFPQAIETPQNITVPIGINELQEGDILQIVYEGLTLTIGEHYTINYNNQTVTLLGFTVDQGDIITFTSTKIVEANDITNITTTFTDHMRQIGSSTVTAHVKLSDNVDSTSDVSRGVAATPKAVYDSKLITDNTTNTQYKFGIENGLLYIEEV